MSLPPLNNVKEGDSDRLSFNRTTTKPTGSSIFSLQSKKRTKKKSESELRAAKDKEQKLLQLYDLWLQVKEDEKDLKSQYLRERVAIQHQLIEKQEILSKKRQAKKDYKNNKEKEANRISKLAQLKYYTDYVKDVLAQEKTQKSSLKSHSRILSSHQPVRIPTINTNSPSKNTIMTEGRSRNVDSDTDVDNESILLSDNFSDLVHESVEVQLHSLLGPEALNFLKPTFRDGAKKSLDPLIERYKTGGIGAQQLWGTLRGKSMKKLEHEDDKIPQDLKNSYKSFLRECLHSDAPVIERSFLSAPEEIPDEKLSESHLIKDINFARHRLDLMYRVAHMNKDKTRLLFNNMESVDAKDGSVRPSRYDPNQIKDKKISFLALPPSFPHRENLQEQSPSQTDKPLVVGNDKIVFLTEKMATCKGEFSKRHNAAGSGNDTSQSAEARSSRFRAIVSAPVSSQGERNQKLGRLGLKSWQPLSLSALIEYKEPIALLGDGDFLQGQTRKWKIDPDIKTTT